MTTWGHASADAREAAAPVEATSLTRPRDSVPSRWIWPQNLLGETPPQPEPGAMHDPPSPPGFCWYFLLSSLPPVTHSHREPGTPARLHLPSTNLKLSKGSAQLCPVCGSFPQEAANIPSQGSWSGSSTWASPRSFVPAGSVQRQQWSCREGDTNPFPFPHLPSRDSDPMVETFCLCSVTKAAGCLKRRLEKHPGTPREGDAVSYPAEFPFLLQVLFETHRREQPVHSACWKEIDLKVTRCMKLL